MTTEIIKNLPEKIEQNVKSAPLKELKHDFVHWGHLIGAFAAFTQAKTIVEIGVQQAKTTSHLCKAAKRYGGHVYGFDMFDPVPNSAYEKGSYGNLEQCHSTLKRYKDYYTLYKMDVRTDKFKKTLEKVTNGNIDLAFIDACHSYNGALNDFKNVYPLLSKTGIVVFHDTYSHVGLRKLNVDLRTKYYDGTFDVIELPFGKKRVGLTILVKRSYMFTNAGIINFDHDPDMKEEEVYKYENNFLLDEIKRSKPENEWGSNYLKERKTYGIF